MLSWKGPTRAIKVYLLAQELPHVPESIVQMLLELCQAWCCDHCPGQPVQCLTTPWMKNLFLISNLNIP